MKQLEPAGEPKNGYILLMPDWQCFQILKLYEEIKALPPLFKERNDRISLGVLILEGLKRLRDGLKEEWKEKEPVYGV